MGYRGKLEERERARELRSQSWTVQAIADELAVSKSSVSTWVRDVDFVPTARNRGHPAGPKHPMRLKKESEIEQCRVEADKWVGLMSERDLAMFCLGLYAGEGSKTPGTVCQYGQHQPWAVAHAAVLVAARVRPRRAAPQGARLSPRRAGHRRGNRVLEPCPGNPAQPVSEALSCGR